MRRAQHRPAYVTLLLAALIAAFVTVPVATAEANTQTSRTSIETSAEARMFERHNHARQRPSVFGYGGETSVDPLLWSADLAAVARAWSDQMARANTMSHNPHVSTESCCWRRLGENVGTIGPLRSSASVEELSDRLVQAWMDSAGHRRNMMDGTFEHVGIGVSVDGNGRMWATVVFRTPTSDAPAGSATYEGSPVEAPKGDGDVKAKTLTIRDDRHACPSGKVPDAGFTDMKDPDRRASVNCLAWWDVTSGTTPTTYSPSATVRRDQMASFIARAIENSGGHLPAPTKHHFGDVDRRSPHAESINKLAQAGIIGGFADGTFGPQRDVTRGQMAKFLAESFEHRTNAKLDAPSHRWFSDTKGHGLDANINQIAEAGWAGGYTDGTYKPSAEVRRDHMALFVTRWLSNLVEDGHANSR